ncbi:MAG: DUF3794 domain-containing protein [Clostridia bacterium]|nr:DUF3794 domain-containing protein [Clostridia bacterium]
MNVEKIAIKSAKQPVSLSGQQNIETDIILPDYYDNISKILKCTIKPFVEAVTSTDDRISIAGSVTLSLLYSGEDKKLYHYENEIKYTKILNNQGYKIGDNITAEQHVSSCSYRAVGPKRVDLKGVIQIYAKIYEHIDADIITSIESEYVHARSSSLKINMTNGLFNRDFTVSDEFKLNSEHGKIRTVIRKDCKISINEKKTIVNKIFIKGTCKMFVIYITEETNAVNNLSYEVPFSEVVDAYGVEENDEIEIYNIQTNVSVNIKNQDSDTPILDTSIDISLCISAAREQTIDYIDDVYSSMNEISATFNDIDLENNFMKKTMNMDVSFEADSFIDDDYSICDSYIDDIKLSSEIKENKMYLLINANYNALIKLSDGTFSLITRNFTAEREFISAEITDRPKNMSYDMLSVSALRMNDGKIRFMSDYFIETAICSSCKIKALTALTESENPQRNFNNGIILYYAQKGEDLWSIAKENRTTVETIKASNEIADDSLTESRLLVFPNY